MANNYEDKERVEETLDINEINVSKESMFHHKLRKRDRKIKNSEKYNNKTIIYVISMVALFVIWVTAFAQPLAYNNRLLLMNNNEKNNNQDNNQNNNQDNNQDNNQNNNQSNNRNNNQNNNEKNDNQGNNNHWNPDNPRWNVGFTNMYVKEKTGFAKEEEAPTYTSTRANFHVRLEEPGDEISYKLEIKNTGTIDAKVDGITISPISNDYDPILYTVSDINIGDELDAGKSTGITVKIKYNPNYTGTETTFNEDLTVSINYIQK